jgi:glycosyltransferase involved in cell wall biosynthesis
MVSLTKGEGFGRPLLEFSLSKKPIIASNWSGHIDFLHPEYNVLVNGTLNPVHKSAQAKNMILAESSWFTPNDGEVADAYKSVYNDYDKYLEKAKRQAHFAKTNYSFDKMAEMLNNIFETKIPKQVELKLPALKKLGSVTEIPKISLPKLKKLD